MAKVEIEEADLLSYQHISGVVDKVMRASPQTRTQFLHLAKQADPKLSIPEVDAAAPVIGAVHTLNKKMDDFIAAQAAKEREAAERAQISSLQGKWNEAEQQMRRAGWRQAGIDQVKKFAETNGIADLSIAADAFERRNPQPEPATSRVGWNLFTGPEAEDTYIKDQMAAMGDSESRLDKEIRDTLAEVRSANY
jgi:hypothetical protein